MSTPDRPDHTTADAVVTGRGEVPEEWRSTTDALADLRSLSESAAPPPSPALAELLASGGAAAHAPTTADHRTNPMRRFVTRSLATLGITGKVALATAVAAAAVGGGAVATLPDRASDVAVAVVDDGLEQELPEPAAEATMMEDSVDETEGTEEPVEPDLEVADDDESEKEGPSDEIAAFREENDAAEEPLEGCAFGQAVASIARGDDPSDEDDDLPGECDDSDDSEESEESEESADSDEESADSDEESADSDEESADTDSDDEDEDDDEGDLDD